VTIEKPPGLYTLTVMRDGYGRNDQSIELKAGEALSRTVTLEPSPDTGFELMSEPAGGLVWLDGNPVKDATGQQAHTNFRASRISPGHHKLEIRSERFKPWQEDVEIEPGKIRKVTATLIPAGAPSGGSGSKPVALGMAAAAGGTGEKVAMVTPPPSQVTPPTPPTPPTVTTPPGGGTTPPSGGTTPPGGGTQARSKSAGGGSSPGGSALNASTGSGAGGIASPPTTPKRKRVKEPTDDSGGGEIAGDEPAPRRTVAPDDSGGGGDCSITINSIPWSEVWIDGKNTTKHTPVVDFKVPCGKHKLAFKRPDMQIDQTESINVRPGQNFKQRYTLATED